MSNQLRKKIGLILLLLIIASSKIGGQEKNEVPSLENVYLHTDRDSYTLGESLWYKAYSVYPFNNLLYNKSGILYVELISPEAKVIIKNKTKLENGIGNGDFNLVDSLGVKKPGIYQLRAYTNWNRNFDNHFIFKKEIEILNIASRESYSQPEIKKPKRKTKADIEDKQLFDVQFFPEGGSLIADTNNEVAFKAVDNNGFPIAIKGSVYDSNNSLVTPFITIHEGMGKFQLNPKSGQNYYVKVSTTNGTDEIKLQLPKAREEGFVLSSKMIKGKTMLIIKTNNKTFLSQQNKSIKIICKSKAVTYFNIEQPLTKQLLWLELPKDKLPSGINQITLYDSNNRPQSERLIFNNKDNDIDISINTDKKTYTPEEKVTVTVSSKTKAGDPLLASYSLSCTDMNGFENKGLKTNICSYYLMESDIRGKVYNPGFYFNTKNVRRFEKLDLLLLTQGWRDFLWKEMPKPKETRSPFLTEKGINLSGRIQGFNKKPLVNNNITLTLFNDGKLNMATAVSDSQGMFRFQDIMFYGESKMILTSKNNKGKDKGLLFLDNISRNALEVSFNPQLSKMDTLQNKLIKENILKKYMSFGIMPDNVLDEVEIIAKKEKQKTESIFGTADRTITFDDDKQNFSSIYQMIQVKVPGIRIEGTTISFTRFRGPALIYLDGTQYESSDISFILPSDVAKIETITGAAASILGSNGGNGALLIYMKEGALHRDKIVNSTIKQPLEGFAEPRIFYAPKPSEISNEDEKESIRNTLYWNPYVHPNEDTGITEVDYYNTNVDTHVNVTLEGITATGIPIVLKTNYIVEK